MASTPPTSDSRLLERRQSYDRIPRFFFPKADVAADHATLSTTARALCRERALERIDTLLLTSEELARLTNAICRHARAPKLNKLQMTLLDKTAPPSRVVCVDRLLRDHTTVTLSYDEWKEVAAAVRSAKVDAMMSAQMFLMLPQDDDGRVNGLALLEYLYELHRSLTATRYLLAQPEGARLGLLSELELTEIIRRGINEAVRDKTWLHVDANFESYYELICTRLVVLRQEFQGPRAVVSVDELASCQVFLEWLQLTNRGLHDLFTTQHNRFAVEAIRNIHRQYVQLDRDRNGMLSADELMDFGKKKAFNPVALTPTHDLTRAFVTQVFHETATFPPDNEMDYKAYVDFTLRMADRSSLVALRFFWNVLDFQKQGFLDAFTIDFFLRDLVDQARFNNPDDFPADETPSTTVARLRTQVFDLVAPRDPARITWRDLTQCKLGHLVVRMLTDTVAYRAYEACDGKFSVP